MFSVNSQGEALPAGSMAMVGIFSSSSTGDTASISGVSSPLAIITTFSSVISRRASFAARVGTDASSASTVSIFAPPRLLMPPSALILSMVYL